MLRPKRLICARSLAWFLVTSSVVIAGKVCADQTYDQSNPSHVWDTATLNWNGPASWINTTSNNAIFTGTSVAVDVNGAINVGNITFNSGGWNIGDPTTDGTLNFAIPSTVTVTNAADTDTISANIASGGLTKAGLGTLTLSGTNSFSGDVTVNTGTLRITTSSALGDSTGVTSVKNNASLVLANGVNVTGETIGITGSGVNSIGALYAEANASATWGGTVNIDAAGARVGAGSGGVLNITGIIKNGAGNTAAGAGTLAIGETIGATTPGVVIISGTNNTYNGLTQIVRGVLKLGATNALPGTTVVDVSSSGTAVEDAVFDLNGFNQSITGLQRTNTVGAGIVTNNGAAPSTLTITGTPGGAATANGGLATFSGIIRDGTSTVSLAVNGGTFVASATTFNAGIVLAGANTYTGTTTIGTGSLAGVVSVMNNLGLGSTAGATVVNNGQVVLGNGIVVTGETITINGNGTNNYGALQTAPNASATWAGPVIAAGGAGIGPRIGSGDNGVLTISGVISGGGTTPILFDRGANATTILNAVNTYTGDTTLFANSGTTGSVLKIGVDNAINAGSRLIPLGGTQATVNMTLDLNGHILTLRALDTTTQSNSAPKLFITNTAAGTTSTLTISSPNTGVTDNGVFAGTIQDGASGTGIMAVAKSGANTEALTGNNTYTGSTTVNSGTLQLGIASAGNTAGTIASTNIILNGGTFALNNTGASNNNTNRISNSAVITMKGGTLLFTGSDQPTTNSSETFGTLALNSGISKVTATAGGNLASLTAGLITRNANGGIALVNGVGLGKDATSNVGRIFASSGLTLIGTTNALNTGNVGAKDTKIVPYLLGEATNTTGGLGTITGTADTFVTYEASTGFRPLNPTDEFTQNSFVSGNNTRLTAATSVNSTIAINSLLLDGGAVNIAAGQTLTVSSGAILFSTGLNSAINGGTLDFGATEGIITVNANAAFNPTITSLITGSAGVSYYGTGTLILGTQQSTYSGNTLLAVATVIPQTGSTGPAGAPTSGPFGTGTVILGGSAIRAATSVIGGLTIANPINFAVDTTVLASSATDQPLTFSGPVTLTGGSRTLTQNSNAATTFSGNIGDGGNSFGLTVVGSGTGSVILSGNSTYTGATLVKGGTVVVSGALSGSSAVTVGDAANLTKAAILGGSGTVGNVTIGAALGNTGATLKPTTTSASASTGTTFHAGSVTFANSSAHLSLQIGRNTPFTGAVVGDGAAGGDISDHLATTGTLSLNGADLQLSLLTTGYTPANGDLFFLTINSGGAIGSTFSSLNGTITDLSEGAIFTLNAQFYKITYLASYSSDTFTNGHDIALLAVVPEPGSLVSLLGGLGCLLGAQRFRRSWRGDRRSAR